MSGPLAGIRVLELAALGPVPFGVMLLADLGAEVIRVDRTASVTAPGFEATMRGLSRGRRSIAVDLKSPEGVSILLRLIDDADVLVEGFRPGVLERLGIGPDVCRERNGRLVVARTTGWGQDGPLAERAGHDIDYAAIAGALHPVGVAHLPPPPPLNMLADFGGGGTFLALGVLAALLERERSGQGQVIDVAMIDGTAVLTTFFHGLMALDAWTPQRESNLLDGAAPFYRCYTTSDGAAIAVGCIEPQFYAAFLACLGLRADDWPQHDHARWPAQYEELARLFATRTRDEWEQVFAGSDACVAPVLSLIEAPQHAHNVSREVFTEAFGMIQPAPAPRFERTPSQLTLAPPDAGEHTDTILAELGFDGDEVARLRQAGTVA